MQNQGLALSTPTHKLLPLKGPSNSFYESFQREHGLGERTVDRLGGEPLGDRFDDGRVSRLTRSFVVLGDEDVRA